MLELALKAGLPLIYVKTDDILNVSEVLAFIAGETVNPIHLPPEIGKLSDLKVPQPPDGSTYRVFYTSSDCKSLAKLYRFCVDNSITIVFVNTEKSVLHFDGGQLVPPRELVRKYLSEISDDPDSLLPAFGGMTLKDVGEVGKLTMTRDESLTARGVNETRRGYRNLRGITPVATDMSYYLPPAILTAWLGNNRSFFVNPVHESLIPRGLLLDGHPGVGKTMAAKHIASAFGVPLYRIDIGGLKGKYVGQSEENLLAALTQVDEVEPCVVILDEVEKVFVSQSDSGVTTTLLSQLLWWLQEHKSRVFTVMTTNDITKIPVELYREGRIDVTMAFLGIESWGVAYEFAKGAFVVMMASVDCQTHPDHFKKLQKVIQSMYADGQPVPQSKLTQETYSLVRKLLSEEVKS